MTPEQRLWERGRRQIQVGAAQRELLTMRVEAITPPGIADVLALRHGRVTPVELKVGWRRPRGRLLRKDEPSIEQRNWHLDWHRHGGRSLVVVGLEEENVGLAFLGSDADLLVNAAWRDVKHLVQLEAPEPGFWQLLRKELL